MRKTQRETRLILLVAAIFFGVFLMWPIIALVLQSFRDGDGWGMGAYLGNVAAPDFIRSFGNSLFISLSAASITTAIAFAISYAMHQASLPLPVKRLIRTVTVAPMFLPTITYGFVIIYAFGRQGLVTHLLGGVQLFDIYGPCGLLAGYVMYTVPIAFLLIDNAFGYIDRGMGIVSHVMGDSCVRRFIQTVARPMVGTLAAVFIQAFTLCFTDFGIPASIGGRFDVVAIRLYDVMLGSIPDLGGGAAIAMMMLLPSVASIILISWLERYNVRYNKITRVGPPRSRVRDILCGTGSVGYAAGIVLVFSVMFVVPFVKGWPYDTEFDPGRFLSLLSSRALPGIYGNTVIVSLLTALGGTVLAYSLALVTARSPLSVRYKHAVNALAVICNTIPGMVLGLSYLFAFGGTSLQNTFAILIVCNIVHYFTAPYWMGKNSLEKLNRSWEETASLMGDSWLKTLIRVIVPNSLGTVIEIFSYYFINSMITVSAVIFLVGAGTGLLTTQIKSLQHLAKFDEIFVVSILILATNLAVRMLPWVWNYLHTKKQPL